MGMLQKQLAANDYLLDGFSVADAYLFAVLNWAPYTGVDLALWPAVGAYYKRLLKRASVAEALAEEVAIYEQEVAQQAARYAAALIVNSRRAGRSGAPEYAKPPPERSQAVCFRRARRGGMNRACASWSIRPAGKSVPMAAARGPRPCRIESGAPNRGRAWPADVRIPYLQPWCVISLAGMRCISRCAGSIPRIKKRRRYSGGSTGDVERHSCRGKLSQT
jgi:Glutathione S-transferase, C-terminal domain